MVWQEGVSSFRKYLLRSPCVMFRTPSDRRSSACFSVENNLGHQMKLSRIRKPRERDDGVGEECPWYAPRRPSVIGVMAPVLFCSCWWSWHAHLTADAEPSTDSTRHTSAGDKHIYLFIETPHSTHRSVLTFHIQASEQMIICTSRLCKENSFVIPIFFTRNLLFYNIWHNDVSAKLH